MKILGWSLFWLVTVVGAFFLGDFVELNRETILPTKFGRFLSKPHVEFLDNRDIKLLEDFVYVDPQDNPWLAPKDSVVDGASIPQIFWTGTGGPLSGKYRNASIVHDVECDQRKRRWEDVHLMFYHACLAGGVPDREAKRLYWAVARFGPKWVFETRTRVATFTGPDGETQEIDTSEVVAAPLESETPTAEDVAWAAEYFQENDPPIEFIPNLQREANDP